MMVLANDSGFKNCPSHSDRLKTYIKDVKTRHLKQKGQIVLNKHTKQNISLFYMCFLISLWHLCFEPSQ